MVIILVSACIITIFCLIYLWQTYNTFPKIIIVSFILFTILSFIFIGAPFFDNQMLDVYHPVYSDSESISTLSFLIAIAGGLTFTMPIALGYILWLTLSNTITRKKRKERN